METKNHITEKRKIEEKIKKAESVLMFYLNNRSYKSFKKHIFEYSTCLDCGRSCLIVSVRRKPTITIPIYDNENKTFFKINLEELFNQIMKLI